VKKKRFVTRQRRTFVTRQLGRRIVVTMNTMNWLERRNMFTARQLEGRRLLERTQFNAHRTLDDELIDTGPWVIN